MNHRIARITRPKNSPLIIGIIAELVIVSFGSGIVLPRIDYQGHVSFAIHLAYDQVTLRDDPAAC